MKILITGFDPFGGDTVNPAYEAVKLVSEKIGGVEVVKAELPTVYGKCARVLKAHIEAHKPDAVICVGQAGGRSTITVEKVAINLAEARIADNENNMPSDEAIIEEGAAAYFTNLPVKAIVKSIKDHGIPANVSYSAGTFVCNDIMYRLLHMINSGEYPGLKGGFIHVPYDTAQVVDRPNGTPSMPVSSIAKALEYAIEAVANHSGDICEHAGETH